MTEPRLTPDQQHQQRLCQGLVQSRGWQEVVLSMLLHSMANHESLAGNSRVDAQSRLEAVARKDELQRLVAEVYKRAAEPNPFDAARLALWSTLAPPKPMPVALNAEEIHEAVKAMRRGPTSGSVA